MQAFIITLLITLAVFSNAFHAGLKTFGRTPRLQATFVRSLDNDSIQKLEDISSKYARLSNVASPEADAERAQIEEIVQKYKLYKEVTNMMKKIRTMWKNEVSEKRRERQVKSFSELFRGKLEVEEILKEKLGLPATKQIAAIPEVVAVETLDKEIAKLQGKLEDTKLKLPEGRSTREEKFA